MKCMYKVFVVTLLLYILFHVHPAQNFLFVKSSTDHIDCTMVSTLLTYQYTQPNSTVVIEYVRVFKNLFLTEINTQYSMTHISLKPF